RRPAGFAVLRADRDRDAVAPNRSCDCHALLGIRGDAVCPCWHSRHLQRGPQPLAGPVCRCACVGGDVGLFRAEDSSSALNAVRNHRPPAARLSAAIEIIAAIEAQRIPAAQALKEWGTAHRFAGSGDRAAISGLVWDVLRRRASSAHLMRSETPRARVLGMLRLERGMDVDAIAALCDGGRFAPEPLSEAEHAALASGSLQGAPAHIAGDYPEWLDAQLAAVFGEDRVVEATAMASRAPLDLRVNTLK